MLPHDVQLVSVNDHLVEPAGLWTTRLPARHTVAAPRVVDVGGDQAWVLGDYRLRVDEMAVLRGDHDPERRAARFDDMHPAVHEPGRRVEAMDLDGVEVQLIWPNAIGFAGERLRHLADPVLWAESVRAYNDFLLDEFCAAHPTRLFGVAIVPLGDTEAAVSEAVRALNLGARAISFPHHPEQAGLPPLHGGNWTRLFSVLEEAGVPLLVHIGQGVGPPDGVAFGSFGSLLTYMNFDVLGTLVDLVFSQVLLLHPRLRVALIEGGVGWLPYVAERMDFFLKRPGVWDPSAPAPSQLVERSVYASLIDDPNGVRWRHQIGVGRILWQSDFPHRDSFWPHSRAVLERALADVPADDARRIAEDNARQLFSIPRPAARGGGPLPRPG